jgi:ABC-type branched-subunit amino acid transport system substrate-binding protein
LSGRFAQFGQQALRGLEAWCSLDGGAELLAEDDRSDWRTLEAVLPDVARRCDLLLGPYSTVLMRTAGRVAAEAGWLVWNHGGSGDDVEGAHPGHVVSVLTPASRYAEPFLRHVVGQDRRCDLVIVKGPGSFGRQVAEGAGMIAQGLGIRTVSVGQGDPLPPPGVSGEWDLFSAGVFEQDAELASKALKLSLRPRHVCAVAAGVREFGQVADDSEGVFGIAQWFPGSGHEAALGPTGDDFLRTYAGDARTLPDYPAAQAAAGAVLAVHCAKLSRSANRESLWAAAASLDSSTLFGGFRMDPQSGMQVKHQTVLVRWTGGQPSPWPAERREAA